jgi:hypothetical protein
LYSQAYEPSVLGTIAAAAEYFKPENGKDGKGVELETQRCADEYTELEGMTFCPQTLLDVSQLSNYYSQTTIEQAYLASFSR